MPGAQNAAQSFIKPFFLATRLFRYFATFLSLFLSRPFLSLRSPSLSIYFTRYSRFPFYLRCGPPVWGRACSFSGSRDYGEGARQPLVSDQFFFFVFPFALRGSSGEEEAEECVLQKSRSCIILFWLFVRWFRCRLLYVALPRRGVALASSHRSFPVPVSLGS